jgi:hypothetical protein
MRILSNILVVLFVTTSAMGQQINPVPDYIFRNQMSVGRNAPTDTAAYLSVGPRYGANKGLMPPMVVDTNAVTGTKRNGLLIFSVQLNNFAYWDSTTSRFRKITSDAVVDSLVFSTRAWRKKGDDSLGAVIATRTDTALLSTKAYRQKAVDSLVTMISTLGGGTVLSVGSGYGTNFSTITTSGSVVVDSLVITSRASRDKLKDSLNANIALKVNISDTSSMLGAYLRKADTTAMLTPYLRKGDTTAMLSPYVRTAGYGLTKGTQTLSVDSALMATRARVQKGIDSVASLVTTTDSVVFSTRAWRQKGVDSVAALANTKATATGTTNYLSKFTGTSSLGNSIVYATTSEVGISTPSPTHPLDVNGRVRVRTIDSTASPINFLTTDNDGVIRKTTPFTGTVSSVATGFGMSGGTITTTGTLIADTNSMATRARVQKAVDSLNVNIAAKGSGTVTSVAAGTGMSFSTITSTGSVSADTVALSTRAWRQKGIDSVAGLSRVTGSGTTNYVAKFTGSTAVGNSQIFDNGTNLGIGTTTPIAPVSLGNGNYYPSSDPYLLLSRLFDDSNNQDSINGHSFSESSIINRSGNTAFAAYETRGKIVGSNNYDHYVSFQAGHQYRSTGSILHHYGLYNVLQVDSGTVTNAYGLYLQNPVLNSPGVITNNYGLYIADQTSGTNKYNIYSNSDARSYFKGPATFSKIRTNETDATTLPAAEIEINTNSGEQADLRIRQQGHNYWDLKIPANQTYLDIADVVGSKMVLQNNGNVGIGTTTASTRLHVATPGGTKADLRLSQIGWNNWDFRIDSATTDLKIADVAGTKITVQNSGNVGIANTSPAYKLDVNGSINSSTNFSYFGGDANTAVYLGSLSNESRIGAGGRSTFPTADLTLYTADGTGNFERMRITSSGNVAINNIAPTERLDVNGKARIREIDSSASPINMLWADVNGLVRKAPVPVGSTLMSTDDMTAASGWTIAYDKTQAYPVNDVNKTVDGSIATVTINTAAYRTTATFNTDQWVHVATVPSGFRPNSDVYFSLPNTVAGASFRSTSSVGFTSYNFYQEETAIRVLPSGNVEVYVGLVSNSADLSGANYVIMPIAVTYNIETYPN